MTNLPDNVTGITLLLKSVANVLRTAAPIARKLARNPNLPRMLRFARETGRAVLLEPMLQEREVLRQSRRWRDAGWIFACAAAFVTGVYLHMMAALLLILLVRGANAGAHGFLAFLLVATTIAGAALYVWVVGRQTLRWSWDLRCELVNDGARSVLFGSACGENAP